MKAETAGTRRYPSGADVGGGGLVLVADGIGGLDMCGRWLKWVGPRAGLPHRVEIHHWGHGVGRWLADLTDQERHRRLAVRLVERVELHRRECPGAPVFLVGKSGGAGQVVRALEALEPGAVRRAVLLAPALSPGFDLGPALGGVVLDLVVFHSPLDVLLLGLGTSLFGTIDRVRGVSAGLVGFRLPEGANQGTRDLYARKLRQVKWSPRMIRHAYFGGHFGVDWPPFLRNHVVPLLSPEAGSISDGR